MYEIMRSVSGDFHEKEDLGNILSEDINYHILACHSSNCHWRASSEHGLKSWKYSSMVIFVLSRKEVLHSIPNIHTHTHTEPNTQRERKDPESNHEF
jgi:hypothetical protein